MSNYYEKRSAKVRIAHELMNRGWKVYGYKEDQSDSMTDYYSPAHWDGVATKNGYILVVDDKSGYNSNREITRWTGKGSLTAKDYKTLEKLQQMTTENGATEGEQANAQAMIEKIEARRTGSGYEVVDTYPSYQANGKGYIWHVEKDGALVDKGNQLTIFSDVPESYIFNINTMEFEDSYKYTWRYNKETGEDERVNRTLSDAEDKAVKAFKTFILRLERAVTGLNSCGDGTKATEEQGLNQQQNEKMEKVIEKKVKKVLKMVEVTDRTQIKVGDYLGFTYHGGFWLVTDEYMRKGTWKGVQEERKAFSYERVGSASRGYKQVKNTTRYYNFEQQLSDVLNQGKVKIYELKEVEEVQEVEKWVRVKPQNTKSSKKTESENTGRTASTKQTIEQVTEQDQQIVVSLNEEKNGIEIKFADKPRKEVRSELKAHGFRYYDTLGFWCAKQTEDRIAFANSFINNKSECEQIQNDNTEVEHVTEQTVNSIIEEQQEENPYKPEFQEGFLYDVHFKEWNMTIEEIKTELNYLGLTAYEIGLSKVALYNLNYEQVMQVKNISDKNGSMLFKDEEVQILDSEPAAEQTTSANAEQNTKQNEGNVINMDSILNKFNNIKVENTSRISQEDQQFCIEQEGIYNKAKEIYKFFAEQIAELKAEANMIGEKYKTKRGGFEYKQDTAAYYSYSAGDIEKKIEDMKNKFISTIVSYLNNKYGVSLDYEKIQKKYKDTYEVDYNNVLDEVFLQLNGLTFMEKEENEIKTTLQNHTEGYGKQKVKVNKTKITIDSYVYVDTRWSIEVSYSSADKITDILKGIKHYSQGTTILTSEENDLVNDLRRKIGEVVELNYTPVQSIKIYKNGKLELVFTTSKDAEQFGKKYLSLSKAA